MFMFFFIFIGVFILFLFMVMLLNSKLKFRSPESNLSFYKIKTFSDLTILYGCLVNNFQVFKNIVEVTHSICHKLKKLW